MCNHNVTVLYTSSHAPVAALPAPAMQVRESGSEDQQHTGPHSATCERQQLLHRYTRDMSEHKHVKFPS